jgi:hypothetical protein
MAEHKERRLLSYYRDLAQERPAVPRAGKRGHFVGHEALQLAIDLGFGRIVASENIEAPNILANLV